MATSALDAVDELLRLDLIRETDVPRRFRFRHPLVRRAVYESAPGGWRLGAHERCADALAARGVGAGRARPSRRARRTARRRGGCCRHCATPETQPLIGPQKALPTGSRSRFDFSPTTPPRTNASSSSSRAQERWPRADTSPTRTPPCSKTIELVPENAVALRVRLTTACAGVEHLLGRHEDAHDRLIRRAGEPRGRRLSRSRCPDDRTRDRRGLPDGVRADRTVGPPSARDSPGRSAIGR